MIFDLSGKRVLVIGGSYGMGFATARAAIELGARVAIAARGREKLEAAAAVLGELAGEPVPWTALRIEDRPAVAAFMARHAPFDHLVLPGSTVKPILYQDLDDASAREAFESKFWGPFWSCFDARPHIRKGGSIVLYSGVAAVRPVKGYLMGACINGAINAVTRSLALDFAAQGVRVNTIAPGLTDTPLNDVLHAHDKQERYEALGNRLPVGRIGTADEAAQAAIYLMCNGYVTAEVLGVDGGQQVMD